MLQRQSHEMNILAQPAPNPCFHLLHVAMTVSRDEYISPTCAITFQFFHVARTADVYISSTCTLPFSLPFYLCYRGQSHELNMFLKDNNISGITFIITFCVDVECFIIFWKIISKPFLENNFQNTGGQIISYSILSFSPVRRKLISVQVKMTKQIILEKYKSTKMKSALSNPPTTHPLRPTC